MEDRNAIGGELLDEQMRLTLQDVCRICGTQHDIVVEMVREGIAEPLTDPGDVWIFTGVAVTRIRTALRLQRDLDVNLTGAALALDLLDEIDKLRRKLVKLTD